jgi:hypothetical protein
LSPEDVNHLGKKRKGMTKKRGRRRQKNVMPQESRICSIKSSDIELKCKLLSS